MTFFDRYARSETELEKERIAAMMRKISNNHEELNTSGLGDDMAKPFLQIYGVEVDPHVHLFSSRFSCVHDWILVWCIRLIMQDV